LCRLSPGRFYTTKTHTGSRGLFDELVVAAREQCDLPSLPNATQQIPARPLAF
jgi:hypothetical protein